MFFFSFSASSPKENISHSRMPYDHTSLSEVYRLSKMLSGAIHFTGRNVCGAKGQNRSVVFDSMTMDAWARRTTYASFGDVVVVVHDVSGQSEVADLHDLALGEQDVPGSQVSVDTLRSEKTVDETVPRVAAKPAVQSLQLASVSVGT